MYPVNCAPVPYKSNEGGKRGKKEGGEGEYEVHSDVFDRWIYMLYQHNTLTGCAGWYDRSDGNTAAYATGRQDRPSRGSPEGRKGRKEGREKGLQDLGKER